MSYSKLSGAISFLFFLTLSSFLFGQSSYWGIRGGANFSKVGGTDLQTSMYVGYTGGAFANFYINDRLSFQHELSYSVRGLNSKLSNDEEYKVKLSYIDVPWMIQYNFSSALFLQAGAQISIYTYFQSPQDDSIPYNKYTANALDFSFLLGAGVILSNNLILGVRVNQSTSKTFSVSVDGGKMLNMQAYLAYAINRNTNRNLRTNYGGHGSGR
ncbi:MAG: PorT family protein [Cytophagales bacterium]|nr:PorT family protein [Cytophaga sp.]